MSPTHVGFDPYEQWLGIPPSERPADHYRLLGLPRFESDPVRIEAAADERMGLVRQHQAGSRGTLTQPLLNELAAARNCLMSPEAKSAYDELLRSGGVPAAPLARVVARPAGSAPLPPPLAAPAVTPPVASRQEAIAETDAAEGGGALRSLVLNFLGMAGAVVLVALATYGIGRFLWFRSGAAAARQATNPDSQTRSEEVNPDEQPQGEKKTEVQRRSAVVVMQEGSQDVNLTPATAALSGRVRLRPTGGEEFLDGWSQPGDAAQWTFRLLRPGFFRLELEYAALSEAGETTLAAQIDEQPAKSLSLRPTGELSNWRTVQQTVALTTSGIHTLALRLDGAVEPGSVVIKCLRLAPVSAAADEPK